MGLISAPQMLLIGSGGRNSGKTVFACAVIEKFRSRCDLAAAKVTVIRERSGECPRGGAGCGVCSSLDGAYCLTEETAAEGSKDTQRLLAAGAKRVYWLRVLDEYLEEGATALLDALGKDTLVVCESNSLRKAVEPGLFLMFIHTGDPVMKSSAQAVRAYADRIVTTDGRRFDFDAGGIEIREGRWTVRPDAEIRACE
jgi:hypothetical protein